MLRPLPPRRSISEVIASEKAPMMVSAPPTTRTASAARKPNSNSGTAASAMYEAAPPSAPPATISGARRPSASLAAPQTTAKVTNAPNSATRNHIPASIPAGAPSATTRFGTPGYKSTCEINTASTTAPSRRRAMVVLRHLLIKRAERSKDRRSGVSKHEAAQPCYSASSIAAAIVSAW